MGNGLLGALAGVGEGLAQAGKAQMSMGWDEILQQRRAEIDAARQDRAHAQDMELQQLRGEQQQKLYDSIYGRQTDVEAMRQYGETARARMKLDASGGTASDRAERADFKLALSAVDKNIEFVQNQLKDLNNDLGADPARAEQLRGALTQLMGRRNAMVQKVLGGGDPAMPAAPAGQPGDSDVSGGDVFSGVGASLQASGGLLGEAPTRSKRREALSDDPDAALAAVRNEGAQAEAAMRAAAPKPAPKPAQDPAVAGVQELMQAINPPGKPMWSTPVDAQTAAQLTDKAKALYAGTKDARMRSDLLSLIDYLSQYAPGASAIATTKR